MSMINAEAFHQGHPGGYQGQRNQEQGALVSQIQALFSFPSSRIYIIFGNYFGDCPVVKIGRILLC